MSIDRYHHQLPTEVMFEGRPYPLWNFGQLDRCNKPSLKSRALDLIDGIGRERLPPLGHSKEDMIVWILQVESALALGQGLRGPFGDQVTPLTLGMPKNYVEDNTVSEEGYFTGGSSGNGGGGEPNRPRAEPDGSGYGGYGGYGGGPPPSRGGYSQAPYGESYNDRPQSQGFQRQQQRPQSHQDMRYSSTSHMDPCDESRHQADLSRQRNMSSSVFG